MPHNAPIDDTNIAGHTRKDRSPAWKFAFIEVPEDRHLLIRRNQSWI